MSGEVVVGRHMGRLRATRWGHPNATSGQLDHLPASVRRSSLAGPSRPWRVWSRRGLNGPQQWSTVRLHDRRGCSQVTAGQRFLIGHTSLGWNPGVRLIRVADFQSCIAGRSATTASLQNVFVVPQQAVSQGPQGAFVWISCGDPLIRRERTFTPSFIVRKVPLDKTARTVVGAAASCRVGRD